MNASHEVLMALGTLILGAVLLTRAAHRGRASAIETYLVAGFVLGAIAGPLVGEAALRGLAVVEQASAVAVLIGLALAVGRQLAARSRDETRRHPRVTSRRVVRAAAAFALALLLLALCGPLAGLPPAAALTWPGLAVAVALALPGVLAGGPHRALDARVPAEDVDPVGPTTGDLLRAGITIFACVAGALTPPTAVLAFVPAALGWLVVHRALSASGAGRGAADPRAARLFPSACLALLVLAALDAGERAFYGLPVAAVALHDLILPWASHAARLRHRRRSPAANPDAAPRLTGSPGPGGR